MLSAYLIGVRDMVIKNISVILWQSVLLMEDTGVPGKTADPPQVPNKLYGIMLYQYISS
jgi:hypothetical protein